MIIRHVTVGSRHQSHLQSIGYGTGGFFDSQERRASRAPPLPPLHHPSARLVGALCLAWGKAALARKATPPFSNALRQVAFHGAWHRRQGSLGRLALLSEGTSSLSVTRRIYCPTDTRREQEHHE